jgi:branched-chain amino acid transport system substrate-binding protein
VIEDTKGEVNTATEVAEKLITQDKVFALVGGYGSTTDYGMLQGMQTYEPLFIHVGSSPSSSRTTSARATGISTTSSGTITPPGDPCPGSVQSRSRPKTISMIYEDGNYGSTSFNYAKDYLADAGIELVLSESFKTGSADFSGLLNKVKAANADVVYLVGYANDNIAITSQMAELEVP